MEQFIITENKILINDNVIAAFDFPISHFVSYENYLIVVLQIIGDTVYNRNIFAVGVKGETIWQVSKSAELETIGNCPFADVQIINHEIIAHNWCGFTSKLNPLTGEIYEQVFTK